MKLAKLLHGTALAALYFLAASTVAQAIGIGVLWSRGALSKERIPRYAAAIYGFGLLHPPASADAPQGQEAASEALLKQTQLAARADQSPLVARRKEAILRQQDTLDGRLRELKTQRERYDNVKKSLGTLLDQLEGEAATSALAEVRSTLESLQPQQAKELILRMLADQGSAADPKDDALRDVVSIVKSMSQDRLKKVLGEFKTEQERQTLHRLLVEIGNIQSPAVKEQTP